MMDSPTESFDRIQIVEEPVVLLKMIEKKKDGLIISYQINTEGETPYAIRIRDPLPPEEDIRDQGFHPDHRPRNWGIEDGSLVFEDVVSSEEEVFVVFGAVLTEGLEFDTNLPEPVIDAMEPLESQDSKGISSDMGVPLFRNSTLSEGDSSDGMDGLGDTGGEADEIASPSDTDSPSDDVDTSADETAEEEDAMPETTDPRQQNQESGPVIEEEEISGMNSDYAPVGEPELAPDQPGGRAEGDEPIESSTSTSEAGGPPADPVSDEGRSTDLDGLSTSSDGSVLQDFLDELEEMDLTDEEQKLIRERLGLKPSRAMEVRMRHLESKMGNFSAYTEALEGLINEHGDATEFVTDIQNDIASLEANFEAFRQQFEDAESDRSRIQNQVNELGSDVTELDDRMDERVERVEDEFESRVDERVRQAENEFEERLDDGIRHIESQINDVEQTVAEREEVLETYTERLDTLETALDERVERLQEELDGQNQRVEDRIDDIDDTLGELRSKLDEVDQNLTDYEETFENQVAQVDEQVDSLEETIFEEMDDVWEQVDQLERMRDVFATAFGEVAEEGEPVGEMEEAGSEEGSESS